MSDQEQLDRLAAAQTPYGLGTRSYNRSPAKREIDRQRTEATAAHEASPRQSIIVGLVCGCWSFPFAHSPTRHKSLTHAGDWTAWMVRYWFNPKFNCYQEKTNSQSAKSGLEYWEDRQ